jgi:hypothetical protein
MYLNIDIEVKTTFDENLKKVWVSQLIYLYLRK